MKEPESRRSQKAFLGSDAQVLKALIEQQPLTKREIIQSTKISESTFSRVEPLLLREELIKKVGDAYALFNYVNADDVLEEVFRKYKENEHFGHTLDEVANDVGRPLKTIEDDVYRLGKKYGIRIVPRSQT